MAFLRELHKQLKDRFDLKRDFCQLDEKVSCYSYNFSSSAESLNFDGHDFSGPSGSLVKGECENHENKNFKYAVFVPNKTRPFKGAVILLHGLNERSWEKYLTWAYRLVVDTGRPVVLFPLANHINRSSKAWLYPRQMADLLRIRENNFGKIENSSFANAALSQRIDNAPQVFLSSGLQSITDIVALTQHIKSGEHPLFSKNSQVDFFSYSIGALVTEILLMANPFGLFSSSKAFFFCGGATFDQMDARSKSILDNRAFESLKQYVENVRYKNGNIVLPGGLKPYGQAVWQAFISFASLNSLKKYREDTLKSIGRKIGAIGLKIDKVIPGEAIRKTLSSEAIPGNVKVADFNFNYSHETPFPVENETDQTEVEKAFRFIFDTASGFLKR